MEINVFILFCSVILLLCIGSSKLSNRLGLPTLLIFILLGMIFGSDGIFQIAFDNFKLAEQLCSVALIFIMFYGGFGTNWSMAKPVAVRAVLMSTVGVVITAVLTSFFCYTVLKMDFLDSMLVGAVISSTDAASVFAILRSKNLNLKNGLASFLEVESGSNDPASYMLTVAVVTIMMKQSDVSLVYLIFSQVVYGLFFGILIGLFSIYLLKRVSFEMKGLHSIFVVAIALLAYSLPGIVGGNGYLSVYIAGILLGNSKILHKVELVHFFDGITWIMQIVIFFILGLLSYPSRLPEVFISSLGISLFLTFAARPIASFCILTWFGVSFKEQALISLAGLRGAASIVFAIFAMTYPINLAIDLFHIVFFVSLFSVAFQGTFLAPFARILDLVDTQNTVLKTFTDYQDNTNLKLIEFPIESGNEWIGKTLMEIKMPPDTLVVMIKRKGDILIPKGDSVIREKDILVLNGLDVNEFQTLTNIVKNSPTSKVVG